jgi:hypothetical protein
MILFSNNKTCSYEVEEQEDTQEQAQSEGEEGEW